jgi:hypothetical protein
MSYGLFEFLYRLTGGGLIVLAAVHLTFPRRFRWAEELASLSLLTRQIFYVHTFFVALTVGLMGVLCLFRAGEMLQTPLGRTVSGGFSLFWGTRLVIQWFGYSPALWRGKRFETAVHYSFTALWLWLTLLFGAGAVGVGG